MEGFGAPASKTKTLWITNKIYQHLPCDPISGSKKKVLMIIINLVCSQRLDPHNLHTGLNCSPQSIIFYDYKAAQNTRSNQYLCVQKVDEQWIPPNKNPPAANCLCRKSTKSKVLFPKIHQLQSNYTVVGWFSDQALCTVVGGFFEPAFRSWWIFIRRGRNIVHDVQ